MQAIPARILGKRATFIYRVSPLSTSRNMIAQIFSIKYCRDSSLMRDDRVNRAKCDHVVRIVRQFLSQS